MTVPKLRIEVLGGFEITVEVAGKQTWSDSRPPMNAKYRLLAYLASYGGAAARDDVITTLFREGLGFPEVRLRQELKDLRDELGRLTGRTGTEDRYLYLPMNSKGNIALSELCEIDVAEFTQFDRAAYDAPTPQDQLVLLQAAFDLYQGPLLRSYDALGRLQRKDPNHPVQEGAPSWVDIRRSALDKRFGEVARSLNALRDTILKEPIPAAVEPVFQITLLDNLPQQELDPFIGRIDEKEEIKHLLEAFPLVKLIGAGGCGKTRLALEVAREISQNFDVVWVLELADCKDEAKCVEQIASQIGLKGQQSLEALLEVVIKALEDRRLLLILDNCEHLMEVSMIFIKSLLPGNAKILLTSQFDPYVEGKRCPIGPLPLPNINALPMAEQLVDTYASVQLFQMVAQMNQDDFVVDEQNKELVAGICYAVDGIPLAIRLVASHIRFCALEDILSELTGLLLSDSSRLEAVAKRHSTMAQCVNWAYRTLSEDEKLLLCRFSFFRGGMMRNGFGEVFGFDPLMPVGVRTLLDTLVGKSLISYDSVTKRYRQLEPIRQFAMQQLDTDARKEMERRLIRWIKGITDEVGDGLYIGDGSEGSSVETAIEEIFTIDGAAANFEPANPKKAGEMRVIAMVLRFAEGSVSEGKRTMEALKKVARKLPKNANLQMWLHLGEAVFAFLQSNYEGTARAADSGLKLALKMGAPDRISFSYCGLGIANAFLNNAEAEEQIEKGAQIARSIQPENAWCIALSHMCRAGWLWQFKRRSEAIEQYDLALYGFQHRAKNRLIATFVLNALAHLHCRSGNIEKAIRQYLESIQTKNKRTGAGCVLGTCGIATALECFAESAFFYGAAMRHYEEIGAKLIPPVQADYEEEIALVRSKCGDRYQAIHDMGATLSLPDARMLAQLFLKCCLEHRPSAFLSEIPEKNPLRQKLAGLFRLP